ncbi:hypothetical protein [Halobellus captivus]|uniref:hypothetical protein n=1 Tax=Halobellus captivus TaxID=2592614 RepID=UPI0011A444D8|nr:hypothetical protein [Halobellus captivus]
MADTKEGREKQAADEERRQRKREIEEALGRAEEAEPSEEEPAEITADERDSPDAPLTCHRRNCEEPAAFLVLERYQEETGQGAVEATAALCREHTAEESPTNLDGVYDDYVFSVVPLLESWKGETT